MVSMEFSQTLFARWVIAVAALLICVFSSASRERLLEMVEWQVGEILYHLKGVVTDGDALDVTEVLVHDVGLHNTDSKTKLSTCMCEAADELL